MPVILTLGRYRQTLKACLSYIASSELPWATEDLVPERAKLGMVALIPPLIPAPRRQVSRSLSEESGLHREFRLHRETLSRRK